MGHVAVKVAVPVVRDHRVLGKIQLDGKSLSKQVLGAEITLQAEEGQVVPKRPPQFLFPVHIVEQQLITRGIREANLCVV